MALSDLLLGKAYGYVPGTGALSQVSMPTAIATLDKAKADSAKQFQLPDQSAAVAQWHQDLINKEIADQRAAFLAQNAPGSEMYINGQKVTSPSVTMPSNVNPTTPGTVTAPGSNIGVPTWNQAGTQGNLSQDMWDSYMRAATANQGGTLKPPTTGWM